MPGTVVNPFESTDADLHRVLARLRRESPVVEVPLPSGATAWVVTRHADAQRALSDPRLGKATSAGGVNYSEMVPPNVARAVGRHPLALDTRGLTTDRMTAGDSDSTPAPPPTIKIELA